jgi:outer membrane lipoprotein SlyB
MKFKKLVGCVLTALFCVWLGGCAKDAPPGEYDASEVGKIKKVVPGVILSKRAVRIHNKTTENGVSGSVNDESSESAAENPEADNSSNTMSRTHGFEYVIRLNSGAIISVVQTEDVELKPKQHILVIYGNNTRVVPDEGSDDY